MERPSLQKPRQGTGMGCPLLPLSVLLPADYPTSTRLASAPMASLDRGGPGPGAPLPVVGTMETVRMSFPETWLWELERVG